MNCAVLPLWFGEVDVTVDVFGAKAVITNALGAVAEFQFRVICIRLSANGAFTGVSLGILAVFRPFHVPSELPCLSPVPHAEKLEGGQEAVAAEEEIVGQTSQGQ